MKENLKMVLYIDEGEFKDGKRNGNGNGKLYHHYTGNLYF